MTDFIERSRPETCLSDRMLDRLMVGELADTPDLLSVQAHLTSCLVCQRRRAELESEPVHLPDKGWWAAHATTEHKHRKNGLRGPFGVAALTLVAASAILLVRAKVPAPIDHAPAPAAFSPTASTHIKGAPFFLDVVVRRRGSGNVEPLLPEAALHAGDALRFRVRAPQPGYLAILGLDSQGQVSLYAPRQGESISVTAAGQRDIDGSVILDGALGDERLIAVLCSAPAEAARAIEAARAALRRADGVVARVKNLDLDCLQTRVAYRKQPP